jgi:hypothetical protein
MGVQFCVIPNNKESVRRKSSSMTTRNPRPELRTGSGGRVTTLRLSLRGHTFALLIGSTKFHPYYDAYSSTGTPHEFYGSKSEE